MNKSTKITLELTRDELILVNNALGEITGGANPIPDWEFQTLTGSTKAEAIQLLEKIGESLKTEVL